MATSPAIKTRFTTEDDITAEVMRRFERTPDPRLSEIMLSLTKHIHAFVKDVRLNEGEWWKAIEFLTVLTRRVPVLFVMKKIGADWNTTKPQILCSPR